MLASGGYHGLYSIPELVYGVTPSNPDWDVFRHTDCSLDLKRDKFESKELRSDRARVDVRLGTYKVGGDVGFELSYGAFDEYLEAFLGGTWTNNVLTQGITQRSFSIMRRFTDITQYEVFTGCCPSKLTLNITPNGMVTGKMSFIGSNMTTSLPAGSTYNAASANTPMDCFSSSILEGGTAFGLASAITLDLNNGLEASMVVGSKYAVGISWGRATLTGKLTAFFQDLTMFNKFLNETASSLQFYTRSGTQAIEWLLGNVKYTTAGNPVTDEKPIKLDMSFEGLHSTLSTCLQLTRNATYQSASASKSPSISSSPSSSISSSPSSSRSPSISPSPS